MGVTRFNKWLASVPCSELDGWAEFYQVEPWGYDIETYRAAQSATILANGLFRPKTPYNHDDFIPNLETTPAISLQDKEKVHTSMWKAQKSNGNESN